MKKLQGVIELLKYYYSFLNYDLAKIYLTIPRRTVNSSESHLEAAIRWICCAQDAFNDGGVARSYSLVYKSFFKGKGWVSSYPETTGYIIPTMFDYAKLTGNQDIYKRAIKMADWECDVQMDNGAVQGGTVDTTPTPAIFNTGQVIFGWVRAFLETGNKRYLDSAKKAGDFLIGKQDHDGAWRKELSKFTTNKIETYTYNTRTAWALLYLYTATNNPKYKESAIKNIEFALTQQLPNGWFKNNCLFDPIQPLLHTIAYSVRGILETGILLENQKYVDAAKRAADVLIERQREDGSLGGRFNERWEPTVNWSCLTGNAQTAIIWGRLFQITKDKKYLNGLKKANEYMKSVQLLDTKNPSIYGGISGSYPLHGTYGRFEVLNWAVKFFADLLMLEISIKNNN